MYNFGKTRLSISNFQQMKHRSKIFKIIHISLKKWSGVWIILEFECQLFWSKVSIISEILEWSVICWKQGVVSLFWSSIGGVGVIYAIIFFFWTRL